MSLDGKVASTSPAPGFLKVKSHKCKTPAKSYSPKMKSNSNKSKMKTGPKNGTFYQSEKLLQGECSIGTFFAYPGDQESFQ
jgi:hypothetical protein